MPKGGAEGAESGSQQQGMGWAAALGPPLQLGQNSSLLCGPSCLGRSWRWDILSQGATVRAPGVPPQRHTPRGAESEAPGPP